MVYPIINLRLFNQDLHWYLRSLEEVIIRCADEAASPSSATAVTMNKFSDKHAPAKLAPIAKQCCRAIYLGLLPKLACFPTGAWLSCRCLDEVSGLHGERIPGLTGVWVGGKKVAAIGVRAQRWVTYHGLAINLANDLRPFRLITPCGISDRRVTSVKVASLLKPSWEGRPFCQSRIPQLCFTTHPRRFPRTVSEIINAAANCHVATTFTAR